MKREELQRVVSSKPVAAIGALAAAIAACYVPQAAAQDAGARRIEEVVVTVRRRVEMEQDVPISIKVMGEEFLRTQNITQIEDLGIKVPAMRISAAGGSLNEPIISMRGQRPAESVFAQDPAVPLYFNEVAISPAQGSNLGLYDLESLQVLKGPQGTLFGRNSTGGAVMMTPKRPGTELGGYVELKVGDYDLRGFEGAIDLPINDSWQVRLAARKLDRDGYQKNVANNALAGRRFHDEHSEGARISLNFDGAKLSNLLVLAQDENRIAAPVIVMTGRNPTVGLGGVPPWGTGVQRQIARNDPWKIETDVNAKEFVRNIFASNTTEFELADELSIKNVFGYRKVNFETAQDIDGTAFTGWGTWTNGAPGVTWNPRPTVLESEFFSNELQLLGLALDERLEWITGLYWSKMDATQDYLLQTSPAPSFDSGISTAVNTSKGVFAEGTYTLSDEWAFTAGIRQSWDERELTVAKWRDIARTVCSVTGPGGSVLANCQRSVDEKFDSPTWRFSANYTPMAGHLFYGSISTGYRAGGFNTRGLNDATLKPFNEETVTTYELGHKADWDISWGALRTSMAVFLQEYEDIHHTRSFSLPSGALVTSTENAAEAEIRGLEFEVTLLPIDSLSLNLAYSFVDAEFKKKTDVFRYVPGEVDTTSNPFPYIPEHSVTASATYTLPIDEAVGEMSLTVSYYWQDEMSTHPLADQFGLFINPADPADPVSPPGSPWPTADVAAMQEFSKVDSYGVTNVRFDWRNVMQSSFDVAAYVNNLSDEKYVLGGLNVVDSGGYGGYHYGAPRTIGASLRYTF